MKDVVMTIEEPGERAPAPEPVRLVQRFVNSVDLEDGPELLPDAAALQTWLTEAGLLGPREEVSPQGHARAIELREALRALAYANGGHEPDPRAVETVNAAARRAGLQPLLTDPFRATIEPTATGVDAALGRIVAALHA